MVLCFRMKFLHGRVSAEWDRDEMPQKLSEDDLCQPFSALEPVLDEVQLAKIEYADAVEIERFLGMKVISNRADYSGELGTQLSARFVKAWRKKTRKQCDSSGKVIAETPGWLRRLRLVVQFFWMSEKTSTVLLRALLS